MNCTTVDELAAAYALGAVEPDEERAISEHLAICAREHGEARQLIDAAALVPAAVEAVPAPAALRARIMATVAGTPQEHRTALAPEVVREPPAARRRWQLRPLTTALAAAAVALAVGLGAWNLSLQQRLADRDDVLRAVASAEAVHEVGGDAGSGWLLETGEGAVFVAEGLASLPSDRLYELWLIDPDGSPVAVGTVDEAGDLTVVRLERELGDATVFAVTVEAQRVDAPTSEPVLAASLDS